MNKVIF